MSSKVGGSVVGVSSFNDGSTDNITDNITTNNITINTTKKLSGASELTLNSATGQPIAFQVNGSERLRLTPNGGLSFNTTDPGAGKVILPNSGAIQFVDGGGTARNFMFIPSSSDVSVGSSAWGTLYLESGGGSATILRCGGNSIAQAAANQLVHFRGFRQTRTAVADSAYTVLITDQIVAYTSLSAPRAVTLPSAVTVGAGAVFVIKDESGQAATHNITVSHSTQTIDGAASKVINTNYGVLNLYSNGANWFSR